MKSVNHTPKLLPLIKAITVTLLTGFILLPLQGDVLVNAGFNDLETGDLNGVGGGAGLADTWVAHSGGNDSFQVVDTTDDPLVYAVPGGNVVHGGNRAVQTVQGQDMTRAFDGVDTAQTLYFRYLFKFFTAEESATEEIFFHLTNRDNKWNSFTAAKNMGGLEARIANNADHPATGVAIPTGETHMLVGKVTYTETGYTQVDLWLNPGVAMGDPDTTNIAPEGTVADPALWEGLYFRNGRGALVDEILIGTEWSDVVPPLPTTVVEASFDDLEPGPLAGQAGGIGLAGSWVAHSGSKDSFLVVDTASEPLVYEIPGGGVVHGGSRAVQTVQGQDMTRDFSGFDNGQTVYFRYLFKFFTEDDSATEEIFFHPTSRGNKWEIFSGAKNLGGLEARVADNETHDPTGVPISINETHMLVGKLTYADGGYAQMDLWLDPGAIPGAPDTTNIAPEGSVSDPALWTALYFRNGRGALIDEVMVADSWDAVVPGGLLVNETFDDLAEGDLAGQPGGNGLYGNWVAHSGSNPSFQVIDTSENPMVYHVVGGSTINGGARAVQTVQGQDMTCAFAGVETGQTLYFRFLFEYFTEEPTATEEIFFHPTSRSNKWDVFAAAKNLNGLEARVGSSADHPATDVPIPVGETHMLVGKLTFDGSGYTQMDLWLNPSAEMGAPTTTNIAPEGAFSDPEEWAGLFFRNGRGMLIDEIAIGTSWDNVVPGTLLAEATFEDVMVGALNGQPGGHGLADAWVAHSGSKDSFQVVDTSGDPMVYQIPGGALIDGGSHAMMTVQGQDMTRAFDGIEMHQSLYFRFLFKYFTEEASATEEIFFHPTNRANKWEIFAAAKNLGGLEARIANNPDHPAVGGPLPINETHMLVGKVTYSGGGYSQIDLWLNPGATMGDPDYTNIAPTDSVSDPDNWEGFYFRNGRGMYVDELVLTSDWATAVPGAVLAEATFNDLALGDLAGQEGGFGFGDSWVAHSGSNDSFQVVDTSADPMVYAVPGGGIINGGNQAMMTVQGQDMTRAFEGVDTAQTLYFRYLFKFFTEEASATEEIFFHPTNRDNKWEIFAAAKNLGGLEARVANNGSHDPAGVPISINETHCLVGKVTYDGTGYSQMDLWLDPASVMDTPDYTNVAPEGAVSDPANWQGLLFRNGRGAYVDEVVIASSWDNVVPQMEVVPVDYVEATFEDVLAGDLAGQAGGYGLGGVWTANSGSNDSFQVVDVMADPLVYNVPGGGSINGGRHAVETVQGQDMLRDFAGFNTAQTLYFRLLFRYNTANESATEEIFFHPTNSANKWEIFAAAKNMGGLEARVANNPDHPATGVPISVGETHLLVGKLTYDGTGYSQMDLWVDPSATPGDPDTTNVAPEGTVSDPANWVGFFLRNGRGMLIDELKVAPEWADVVPEAVIVPSEYVLASFEDVDPGPLNGQAGGVGLGGTWVAHSGSNDSFEVVDVSADPLVYTGPDGGVVHGGNHAVATVQGQDMTRAFAGFDNNQTLYFRYLFRFNTADEANAEEIFFHTTNRDNKWNSFAAAKNIGGLEARIANNPDHPATGTPLPINETHMLVGKLTHDGTGYTQMDLWVNPPFAGADPDVTNVAPEGTVADPALWEGLYFRNGRGALLDEIVISPNWEDVVPEGAGPVSLSLNVAENGSYTVSPEKDEYAAGETVTVNTTPDEGYIFRSIRVTYTDAGGNEVNEFYWTADADVQLKGNSTITVRFGQLVEYAEFDATDEIAMDSPAIFQGRQTGMPGYVPLGAMRSIVAEKHAQGLAGVMDFEDPTYGPSLADGSAAEEPGSFLGLYLNIGDKRMMIHRGMDFMIETGTFDDGNQGNADGPSVAVDWNGAYGVDGSPEFAANVSTFSSDAGQKPTSGSSALGGVTSYAFVFDLEDKVVMAGLAYLNNDYFQHYNPEDEDTLWARATLSNGEMLQYSSNQLEQGAAGTYNHYFGFEAPAGAYITGIQVWCSGAQRSGGWRAWSAIDDLTVVLEGDQDYTVEGTASDPANGAVEGGGTFADGSVATLTAVPVEGATFLGWYYADAPDFSLGVDPVLETPVYGSMVIVAEFEKVLIYSQFFNNEGTVDGQDYPISRSNWMGAYGASAMDATTSDDVINLLSEGVSTDQPYGGGYKAGFLYASGNDGAPAPGAFLFYTEHLEWSTENAVFPQPDWYKDGSGPDLASLTVEHLSQLAATTRPRTIENKDYRFALKIAGEWHISEAAFTSESLDDWELHVLDVTSTGWIPGVFVPGQTLDLDLSDNEATPYDQLDPAAAVTGYGFYVDTNDGAGTQESWVRVDSFHIIAAGGDPVDQYFPGAELVGDNFNYESDWFGAFYAGQLPLIYHENHEWLYVVPAGDGNVWMWDFLANHWVYTGPTMYIDMYYEGVGWVMFFMGVGPERTFYAYDLQQWIIFE